MIFDAETTDHYQKLHLALENSGATLERESLLLEMLTRLLERHVQEPLRWRTPKKEHVAVEKVRQYIIEYYSRNISLKELSRLTNLSPFHLTRVFTAEVGMPPHAFQTQVRVARAKKLIRKGLPLSDVAALTGFADQSHFIRQFKRLMKITPGDYLND